jgi:uncharacterized protein (TIGR03382 family)
VPAQPELPGPVRGGCSSAPGLMVLGLLVWARRRRS